MPRSRARKLALVAGLTAGLLVVLVLAASVVLQGARLGKLVTGLLPENRGKIIIGGIDWPLRLIPDLLTDAPTPVKVDGLKILDPEGTVVLDVPHLETRIKVRTLLAGGSFSIHDLKVPKAMWRFGAMKTQTGIGFLAALESKNPRPPVPPEKAGPGSFFHIVNGEISSFHVILDFPGVWGVELKDVNVPFASLQQSSVDPKKPIFLFDARQLESRGGGHLMVLGDYILPFDTVSIAQVATLPEHSDDIFLDLTAGRTGRSTLVAKGYFTGLYGEHSVSGITMHAEFAEAADALQATAHGEHLKLLDLKLGGAGAHVAVDLNGPWDKLEIGGKFAGLDAAYQSYAARNIGFGLSFQGEGLKVGLKDFGAESPDGGRLGLNLGFDANAMSLHAELALNRFSTATYVPPDLRKLAAGRVSGGLTLDADLKKNAARLKKMDLRVERAQAAGLPRSIRVRGDASASPELVRTSGITVEIPGAGVRVQGDVDLARKAVALGLDVTANDLARVLKGLHLPPLARSAIVSAKVGGTFSSPEVDGQAIVQQLGVSGMGVPELRARFGLHDGTATIHELTAELLGGRVEARGQAVLFRQTLERMMRAPVLDMVLAGRGLDLQSLIDSPALQGQVSFEVTAKGTTNAPEAVLRIPAGTPLTVLGDHYLLGPVEIALVRDVVEIRTLKVARVAGGAVDVSGRAPLAGEIDVALSLQQWPLTGIPGVADAGVPISGTLDANVHLGGTLDRATARGEILLADVSARGTRLGQGRIELVTDERQQLHVQGDLFGKFRVAGTASYTSAGLAAHGSLEFDRLVLQELIPELATIADARGTASGRVGVDLEPGKPLSLDVLLRQLQVSLAREVVSATGETAIQRVEVGLQRPMHVSIVGDHIVLDPTQLSTHGGGLEVGGELRGDKLRGSLRGHLDLELVQPFARDLVDRLSGDVTVQLQLSGTTSRPLPRGTIAIEQPIRVRPTGFPSDVVVPSGAIEIGADAVALRALAVTFDGATVRFGGQVGLDSEYRPTRLAASMDGELSAKLLEYVAPDAVSEASGRARVKARLQGTLARPQVSARLELGAIDLRVRDVGRSLQIQSGKLDVTNAGANLHDVRILVDGQGELTIGAEGARPGLVQFKSFTPFAVGAIDLPLHGERMVYRAPDAVEIDNLAFDLEMKGDLERGLELGGEVRLVTGRVIQSFAVKDLVISPRIDESSASPAWEGNQLLEGLGLDLIVRTVGDGFVVQNNLAPELHLVVELHVGGTLSSPQLAGDVRPTDGRLHIPGLRGDFELVQNVNHVTFVPTKSLAAGDTPELNIEAQNLMTDSMGVEHNVRLMLSGPMNQIQIDLRTDGGLDRSQTALLLLTGRAPVDSQRVATTSATMGSNINTGVDVSGQLIRDVVDGSLTPVINDTFERLTGMKLTLTLGPDGFYGRIRKYYTRTFSFQADALIGFQNNQRYSSQLSLRLMDYVNAAAAIDRTTLSPQQGISETLPPNGSIELRLDWPMRW